MWPAPAKVNWFLHITGRRPDGYHELQSLFQFLDFGDTLQFHVRDDGVINRLSEIEGVAVQDDLVVKAAGRLQQVASSDFGVDIQVEKHIPMGGGLGGGSSDAATVLVALNQLWGLNYSIDTLADIGLSLGADVPVFVRAHAAWAEGVGEKLTEVTLEEPWLVVISPGVSVPTAELFTDSELTRDSQAITIRDYLGGAGGNVFEPLVRRKFPAVAAALDWLNTVLGTDSAKMSGTGSSVFVAVPSEERAQQVLEQMPTQWCGVKGSGFKAKALNVSPLQTKCRKMFGKF